MSWTTSNSDLRALISDGAQDKYSFRKALFGNLNGTNKSFKTLDQKRITDFSASPAAPLGVFINNVAATVDTDYPIEGELVLHTAPANGDLVEASYYSQWFLDAEINEFLTTSTQWCASVDDVTSIESGLRPAILHYAASQAYQRLSLWFVRNLAATYKNEDDKTGGINPQAKLYAQSATSEMKLAETLRSQFYTRNDKYKSPMTRSLSGRVPSIQPKR